LAGHRIFDEANNPPLFQFSERKISSRHILILVSGASRCWYVAMQAGQQNCM
jgi:hypothetical protein